MNESEWKLKFRTIAKNQKPNDTWELEFDDKIHPKRPDYGWKPSIRNTVARFRCSECGRGWSSNRAMVVFHMRRRNGMGTVKARPLYQNCKNCTDAPDEMPIFSSENLDILMKDLMEKIREKFYGENLGEKKRHFRSADGNNPHEPDHCQGCRFGICRKK